MIQIYPKWLVFWMIHSYDFMIPTWTSEKNLQEIPVKGCLYCPRVLYTIGSRRLAKTSVSHLDKQPLSIEVSEIYIYTQLTGKTV